MTITLPIHQPRGRRARRHRCTCGQAATARILDLATLRTRPACDEYAREGGHAVEASVMLDRVTLWSAFRDDPPVAERS